jgi:hypothetical protein
MKEKKIRIKEKCEKRERGKNKRRRWKKELWKQRK